MQTLFISDLHLGHEPSLINGFLGWLNSLDHSALDALYILGDFFDAWIGDDEDSPAAQHVCTHLKQFSECVPTYFMRGNRDFLIGEGFAQRTGVALLDDEHVIDLYGKPTLLMHGDSLCTLDQEYMTFRAMVRNPAWQQQVLSLPIEQRRQMAADLRSKSQSLNAMKAEDITDVTPEEVTKAMAHHQVQQFIHGHTHRPAVHDLFVQGKPATRWVLGDWHSTGWCIQATADGLDLNEFQITSQP